VCHKSNKEESVSF
jgi:hypothetical protein